ncbi:MAG: HNH endonuclease [Gammaproteobacteria bacterium]|nr:HNH endonuclease [Gammaproteobacteria bacterium]
MSVKPNTLFTGDNLYILAGMDSESVDLIYLDPPFNSKRLYKAPIGSKAAGAAFKDMWSWDDVDQARLESLLEEYPSLFYLVSFTGLSHSKGMAAYLLYMAQRLVEMRRVLKPTGSVYLHCDPTASHYLKALMDMIFGKAQFLNEIVWYYPGGLKRAGKQFPREHDIVLFYSRTSDRSRVFNLQRREVTRDVALWQRWGKYSSDNQTVKFGEIPVTDKVNRERQIKKFANKHGRQPKDTDVAYTLEGAIVESVWDDCPAVYRSSERTGYPTQKPLSLLDRIIEASSNPGDVVFDPFCGCATTCVSAQNLRRKWIGIDISEVAATLVAERLADAHGKIFTNFTHRSDVPVRTDIKLVDLSVPKTKTAIKKRLYKEQKGICSGCLVAFEARNLDIDHIIPESKGGPSHYDNYQLLCGNCNSIKGNRPMEYLRAKIKARNDALDMQVSFG